MVGSGGSSSFERAERSRRYALTPSAGATTAAAGRRRQDRTRTCAWPRRHHLLFPPMNPHFPFHYLRAPFDPRRIRDALQPRMGIGMARTSDGMGRVEPSEPSHHLRVLTEQVVALSQVEPYRPQGNVGIGSAGHAHKCHVGLLRATVLMPSISVVQGVASLLSPSFVRTSDTMSGRPQEAVGVSSHAGSPHFDVLPLPSLFLLE